MSQERTADGVEAESARIRSQLMTVGADLRQRTDPSAIAEETTSKINATLNDRVRVVPDMLRKQSSPIGLVSLGIAIGTFAAGVASRAGAARNRPIGYAGATTTVGAEPAPIGSRRIFAPRPTWRQELRAAAISAAGIGIGYVAGLFVPKTELEETYLAEPRAVLNQHLHEFIDANTESMKSSAMNLFGASRLSATGLVGLVLVSQLLTAPRQKAKRGPL